MIIDFIIKLPKLKNQIMKKGYYINITNNK